MAFPRSPPPLLFAFSSFPLLLMFLTQLPDVSWGKKKKRESSRMQSKAGRGRCSREGHVAARAPGLGAALLLGHALHPSQNTNSLQLSLSESMQYHSRQCHSFIWSPQVLVASKPH